MKTIITLLCIALTTTLTMGQTILRQRSNTRGLNLSVYGQFTNWTTTNENYKDLFVKTRGPGGGFRIGYGFSHNIEFFGQADGAYVTSPSPDYDGFGIAIAHLEVGGRLNIGSTTSRFRPFVDIGYSLVGASAHPVIYDGDEGTTKLYGRGILGGIGINYFMTIPLAINLRYSGVFGNFNEVYFENDPTSLTTFYGKPDIGIGRASFGLTWYLRGGR